MKNRLKFLLCGEADEISSWLEEAGLRWAAACALVVLVGSGLYGFTVGLWRAPLQSFYTALKFPLLLFLTCAGNALLNGLLAQLLGSGLSFRQTSLAILMSFALTSLILGALSPVSFFVLCNTPALDSNATLVGHSVTLLTHVFFIACAGVIANQRLYRLLQKVNPSPAIAQRVLWSWLGGNFLLGSQLAWVLRPFIGSPGLALEFLRDDPLRGNFYEAVGRALHHVLF
ncbi:MAG TPA: hypothetical protein VH207_02905 [Chthoniobacterales bacterium]|jgi:hypothetical protein|nr:hypothetical protein [Chthoniobacterales bacterium]